MLALESLQPAKLPEDTMRTTRRQTKACSIECGWGGNQIPSVEVWEHPRAEDRRHLQVETCVLHCPLPPVSEDDPRQAPQQPISMLQSSGILSDLVQEEGGSETIEDTQCGKEILEGARWGALRIHVSSQSRFDG